MLRKLRIWWLLRLTRWAYGDYLQALDRASCGMTLAMNLSSVNRPAQRVDKLLDKLEALGHPTPSKRLTR